MDRVATIHREGHSDAMLIDPAICLSELRPALESHPPRSILAVGERAAEPFSEYLRNHTSATLTRLEPTDLATRLDELERHDLVLIVNTFERLDKAQAAAVIGRFRDLLSKRLYVLMPSGAGWAGHASRWEPDELRAYGLSVAARYEVEGKALGLYRHDLYDYKQTPDWLNARNWANPELWDKYRW
jgi:hypothetical protein